jgi:hypothetical protein
VQTLSFLQNVLVPLSLTSGDAPLSLGLYSRRVAASLHKEVAAFSSAIRQQAGGLRFARRSLESDILSIYAAGALIGSMQRGELGYAACGSALRRMLRELFGWSASEAAIRARALLWAFKHGDSLLSAAIVKGRVAFSAWRCAPGELAIEDFRAVYISLADYAPVSART